MVSFLRWGFRALRAQVHGLHAEPASHSEVRGTERLQCRCRMAKGATTRTENTRCLTARPPDVSGKRSET